MLSSILSCFFVLSYVVVALTKRGLADDIADQCGDLLAAPSAFGYTYNWGPSPATSCGTVASKLFVPMAWGRGVIENSTRWSEVPAGSPELLVMNEPNHVKQSNILPADAAAMWPKVVALLAARNISRVSSPTVAPCGGGPTGCNGQYYVWLDEFMGNCSGSCKFDFIATHFYGCQLDELKSFLDSFAKYKVPIWLTEFNCGDGSMQPVDKHIEWVKLSLPLLDARPDIERYSWMSGQNHHVVAASLFAVNETTKESYLLPLGHLYVSL